MYFSVSLRTEKPHKVGISIVGKNSMIKSASLSSVWYCTIDLMIQIWLWEEVHLWLFFLRQLPVMYLEVKRNTLKRSYWLLLGFRSLFIKLWSCELFIGYSDSLYKAQVQFMPWFLKFLSLAYITSTFLVFSREMSQSLMLKLKLAESPLEIASFIFQWK